MTLDEATSSLIAQFAAAGLQPPETMTPRQAREFGAALRTPPAEVPEVARSKDYRIPVSGGSIRLRVLAPKGEAAGVIVYYHGGGWVVGSVEESDVLGRTLAVQSQCVVVLVEYRLAPEYRFPTAVDDAYTALEWVLAHVDQVAGHRVPLLVAGDSAGGNLAAAVSIRARDRHGPPIALQILVYPVTDHDFATSSYLDPDNSLLMTRASMMWFWDNYAPDERSRNHPDASPLRVGSPAGLPPAVVLVAEHDVLRTEGELYATRLLQAGVAVELHRFAGQMHGFFTMVGQLPGSDDGIRVVTDAVRRALAPLPADRA